MKRILRLFFSGDTLVIALRLYLDLRLPGQDPELAERLVLEGLQGIAAQGPYLVDGQEVLINVRIERAEKFSLDALNLRVYDKTPVIRGMLNPRINVSRAFYYSGWIGLGKLERFFLRMPDLYFNLGGRDPGSAAGFQLLRSVVQHEFGHILGFRDQYRGRKFKKRRKAVSDRDLMYRTGPSQRFTEQHIRRLCTLARKERLPLRRV